ncbi:MAG: dihydrofolate reductase family protein [Pseudomonadota bacterium]
MSGRVRVFVACSLDGFIAGPNDDLSWLPPPAEGADHGYSEFFEGVGALLMGRRTYDVVTTFASWPYDDRPVLVATRRPLTPKVPTVRPVQGPITELVAEARAVAQGRDVYVDGGDVIRQALDADRVDALTVTIVPVILGSGHPLFAGATRRHALTVTGNRMTHGLVQLDLVPTRLAS